jgi:type 1 glutamine amidotransferase
MSTGIAPTRWLVAALLAATGACGDDRAAPPDADVVDAAPDGPPPDARPEGVIDGLCTGQPGRPRVLVYTHENLWRHISNYYARLAIYDMCVTRGFNVTTTNDPDAINATRLAQIDVVVFTITSGPGINPLGRGDLEAWLRAGGGIVGLHSASATEPEWQFYYDNIGARFAGHVPGMQPATVRLTPGHPITDGLAASFQSTDEWYFFQSRPEANTGMQMLLALDEDTLPADYPTMYKVGYHPIGWAHELFGGRVFYTALGHNPDSFSDPFILDLVGRSIEWAAHQR